LRQSCTAQCEQEKTSERNLHRDLLAAGMLDKDTLAPGR
jgi:hypothetical protein